MKSRKLLSFFEIPRTNLFKAPEMKNENGKYKWYMLWNSQMFFFPFFIRLLLKMTRITKDLYNLSSFLLRLPQSRRSSLSTTRGQSSCVSQVGTKWSILTDSALAVQSRTPSPKFWTSSCFLQPKGHRI